MIERKVWESAFNKYFDESKFQGVDERQKAFMIGYLLCADQCKVVELMDLIKRFLDSDNLDQDLIDDSKRSLKKINENKTIPFVTVTKPFRNKPHYRKKNEK